MTRTTQFTIGARTSCTDGVCGELGRLVINPIAGTVTHLVVSPEHRHTTGRLVPLTLLDSITSTADDIQLRCTLADFGRLEPAEETHFLPGRDYGRYSQRQTFVFPYYGLGGMALGTGIGLGAGALSLGMGAGMGAGMGQGDTDQSITTETVPDGEISVHRGDCVLAVDGEIGRVQGLVIAASTNKVTHVLLQEGHLFTRKDVAIPISAITDVADGIRLGLTKQQVEDLPAIDIEQPDL